MGRKPVFWSQPKAGGRGPNRLQIMQRVLDAGAPPTVELRPIGRSGSGRTDDDKYGSTNKDEEEHTQLDEEEMGMTYEELGWYGKLRKISRCGPVAM